MWVAHHSVLSRQVPTAQGNGKVAGRRCGHLVSVGGLATSDARNAYARRYHSFDDVGYDDVGIATRVNGTAPPDVPLSDIDLGSVKFWSLDDDIRDGAFTTLRREAPVSFHPKWC